MILDGHANCIARPRAEDTVASVDLDLRDSVEEKKEKKENRMKRANDQIPPRPPKLIKMSAGGRSSDKALAVAGRLTLRWKHATMGSFFIVSCLVDSW